MQRIIKILKLLFQQHNIVTLSYLSQTFGLSIRTIQSDISAINKILQQKNKGVITIKNGKASFSHINFKNEFDEIINYLNFSQGFYNIDNFFNLILFFVWQKEPATTKNILVSNNIDFYLFKKYKNLINNYFIYYSLNLKILFKNKKGWIIQGDEKTILFVAANILNNNFVQSLTPNLNYFFVKIQNILNLKHYEQNFYSSLKWFLLVFIKRFAFLDKIEDYHLLLSHNIFLNNNKEVQLIADLLSQEFNLNFNQKHLLYLKIKLFLNKKEIE